MKAATVALVIKNASGESKLVETLSDDTEIAVFETAVGSGEEDPLEKVYEHRAQREREEAEFGDYVEELLSHPFQKKEVRDHGLQWLKSKMRIEEYQRHEAEAARVIAQYAFEVFNQDPGKQDFFLAGPTAQVHIRVFLIRPAEASSRAA